MFHFFTSSFLGLYNVRLVFSCDCVKRALEEKKLARQEAIDAAKSAKQSFEDKNGVLEVYSKVYDIFFFLLSHDRY